MVKVRRLATTAFVLPLAAAGCASHVEVRHTAAPAACRTVELGTAPAIAAPIRWVIASTGDGAVLDRWCGAVGPALVSARPGSAVGQADEVAIVSWNVHVGGGDVERLVADLRAGILTGGRPVEHFVLLLQEAFRSGRAVPSALPALLPVPAAIRPVTRDKKRVDVATVAHRLGLSLYYVPSMRNGAPRLSDEDRGNAILSTLPLSDLHAVELPFERQRRVAVSAVIGATSSRGAKWALSVTSAHLDNLAGPSRAWVITGPARRRQARGLLAALPARTPAVVGGDFNTWFGTRDAAYAELVRHFPQRPPGDDRPTFGGLLRLDHVFFRLPPNWQASWRRIDRRYGSDHHPLLAMIEPGRDEAGAASTAAIARLTASEARRDEP